MRHLDAVDLFKSLRASNWGGKRPGKNAYKSARDKANCLHALPKWVDDDHRELIRKKYEIAACLTVSTNTHWSIDHIVPLRGETVSGLHVAWNLKLMPLAENNVKGNQHV